MRVGLNGRFYGARITGVQRFAREIASRLVDHVDVTVLLPADAPDPDDLPASVPRTRGTLRGQIWEQLELPAMRSRAGCDVLLHLAATAPVWSGPQVMAVHDVFPISHPEWFAPGFARWYRLSLGPAARRAAMVLAMSAWSAREIARVLRVRADRISVVSQGVAPFHGPAHDGEVARVRARWGLAGPYLLAVGAGDPRKNLSFLEGVMQSLETLDGPAPALVVAGAGLARVHGTGGAVETSHRIKRLGYVADAELRALYTGAAAFCYPSLAEGFGRPPLEAMACGAPVVAADYGPAREVLGHAAEVLPLESTRWVETLRGILADDAAGRRRAAGMTWAQRFSWDTAVADVAERCREVADAGRARRRSA